MRQRRRSFTRLHVRGRVGVRANTWARYTSKTGDTTTPSQEAFIVALAVLRVFRYRQARFERSTTITLLAEATIGSRRRTSKWRASSACRLSSRSRRQKSEANEHLGPSRCGRIIPDRQKTIEAFLCSRRSRLT